MIAALTLAVASFAAPDAAVAHVEWCHSDPAILAECEWRAWMADPVNAEWFAAQIAAPEIPWVLARIRGCESGGPSRNFGPNEPGMYGITNYHHASTSSGAYQMLDGTWRAWRGDSTAPRAYMASRAEQDRAALALYHAQGTRPWAASQHCWEADR